MIYQYKKNTKHVEKLKWKFLHDLPRTSPSTGTSVISHGLLSQHIAPPVPPVNNPLPDTTQIYSFPNTKIKR